MTTLSKSLRRSLFVLILLILFSFTPPTTQAGHPGALRLQAPLFLSVAYAQEQPANAAVIHALTDEAGIAAYFDRGSTINLQTLDRGIYHTIEHDGDDYLLGSVQVKTNNNTYIYPETEDVHVYISASGWVLAYYLKADPVAKIFDVVGFNGNGINTKLELALGQVAASIGASFTPTFYHFSYPNATHLYLIGDKNNLIPTDEFKVNLPPSFSYAERSWALWSNNHGGSGGDRKYLLNDKVVVGVSSELEHKYGIFTVTDLPAGSFNKIDIYDPNAPDSRFWSVGVLALVY